MDTSEAYAKAKKSLEDACADPELVETVRALTDEELKQMFTEATIGIIMLKEEIDRRSPSEPR